MHVVLYQPSIPPNTGNIGRLCIGMNCSLQIIGPCNFDFSDKALRRAGLDYWPHLDWKLHETPEAFLEWLGDRKPWLVTKFGVQRFDQAPFESDDLLIFGNEQKGLPEEWRKRWANRCLGIPIQGPIRSYNLANSVAMVLSQAQIKVGDLPDIVKYVEPE